MKKRIVILICVISMLLIVSVLSACGSAEETKTENTKSQAIPSVAETVSDQSTEELYTLEDWLEDNDPNRTILSVDSVSDVSGNTIIITSDMDIDPSIFTNESMQEVFLSLVDEACGNGSDLESVAKEAISTIEKKTGLPACRCRVIFNNKAGDEIYKSDYDVNGFCGGWLGDAISGYFPNSEKAPSISTGKSSSSNGKKSSSTSFTNKYGTSTTKCAHPGCNNYIASSGDTNCCTVHSNKCLECGKYIDEDATWCMDCLTKSAFSGSSSYGSSSNGSSYGSSGSSSSSTEKYPCMGKNDTCPNYTYSPYDFYCSSCDPDGDNVEG